MAGLLHIFKIPLLFAMVLGTVIGEQANEGTQDQLRQSLRFSIPGVAGQDYPTLDTLPSTSFTCRRHLPGHYVDASPESRCQMFHICGEDGKQGSFLCPIGTLFNQKSLVCELWNQVDCRRSWHYYGYNAYSGQPPFSWGSQNFPAFPRSSHGGGGEGNRRVIPGRVFLTSATRKNEGVGSSRVQPYTGFDSGMSRPASGSTGFGSGTHGQASGSTGFGSGSPGSTKLSSGTYGSSRPASVSTGFGSRTSGQASGSTDVGSGTPGRETESTGTSNGGSESSYGLSGFPSGTSSGTSGTSYVTLETPGSPSLQGSRDATLQAGSENMPVGVKGSEGKCI